MADNVLPKTAPQVNPLGSDDSAVSPSRPDDLRVGPASGRLSPWRATGLSTEDLPRWVHDVLRGGDAARLVCEVGRAAECSGSGLEALAHEIFGRALASLEYAPARVWAFLPGVDEPDSRVPGDIDGLNRYMRMNIGRYRAYREAPRPLPCMPAGTCVGHGGHDLVVYAMGFLAPMRAVENPRQRAAWQYSARFGPTAPPFTRGVVVGGLLLASGTASVVGEDTVHEGDFDAQWNESLANLDALRSAAGTRGKWRSLQVYIREREHLRLARDRADRDFPGEVERVLLAPLCRSPLLVEMEGIAHVES